jgi:hypothetical protein
MCLARQVGLMVARASQTRHTRPRLAVNSTSMARGVVNSGVCNNKQAFALVYSSFSIRPGVFLHSLLTLLSTSALLPSVLFSWALSPPTLAIVLALIPSSCYTRSTLTSSFSDNSTSAFSCFSQHHLSASLPTTHHLHTLPSMPRERGKSKRGARYYNTLSRRNRLSPSQLALIAHFTSPQNTNQRSQEAPSSTPLQLHGINPVKEEASPSCARTFLRPPLIFSMA